MKPYPSAYSELEIMLRAAPTYFSASDSDWYATAGIDTEDALFDGIQSPRAKSLNEALAVVRDVDLIPTLMGYEFECDLVLRHHLAELKGVSASSLPKSNQFADGIAQRVHAAHRRVSGPPPKAGVDWSNYDAVVAAIENQKWAVLALTFREAEETHVRTLVELSADQLLALARSHRHLALRIANAALFAIHRRDFVTALRLYDAAVEGDLPREALANPLYAAQNDNNKLGLNEERARRYLARCVFDDGLPMMFANAACVAVEIGELDLSLKYLTKAKSLGASVSDFRDDPLFAPLKDRPDFRELVR